jgi:hypothetical protein
LVATLGEGETEAEAVVEGPGLEVETGVAEAAMLGVA